MLILSGINLIKVIVVAGLAIWNLLEGIGLVKDFNGAQRMVGKIMSMELIEAPPAVPTALMSRRVNHSFWHKAGAAILVLLNFLCAFLLLIALCGVFIHTKSFYLIHFLKWSNLGLAVFLIMGFSLSFTGLWFAYYIKQGELMITHFVLIVLGIAAAGLINMTGL